MSFFLGVLLIGMVTILFGAVIGHDGLVGFGAALVVGACVALIVKMALFEGKRRP